MRAQFLDDVAPQLLALAPRGLQMDLDDERRARCSRWSPVPGDELPVRALRVDLGRRATTRARRTRTMLARRPASAAPGYLVTESLYRDYGDNEHAAPRDWPDGATFARHHHAHACSTSRRASSDETFYGHWYGHQSPMSEWMQPRARYVRNAVVRALTPGAPRVPRDRRGGVADASSTSPNLHTFFGATRTDELGERIRIMLDSTKLLYDPATMRNYTLSEYILKS